MSDRRLTPLPGIVPKDFAPMFACTDCGWIGSKALGEMHACADYPRLGSGDALLADLGIAVREGDPR